MDGIPGLPGRSGLPGKKVRTFEMLGTSVLKYIWTRSVHYVYVLVTFDYREKMVPREM